ncbi:MAG: glycerate kinase [Propionibacteriaceae bacterium]|jgi:glycerate kinase|nr:glycerate kinase [Propionibacteriaceae bacterium]
MTASLLLTPLRPQERTPIDRPLRVVIAPDSFKGTLDAQEASHGIAQGWLEVRPNDQIQELPQADGGEGTARLLTEAVPGARWIEVPHLTGPDSRPVSSGFGLLPDGTAMVDLASASGIIHMVALDPLGAHTIGLGELLRQAVYSGARRIVVGLGGSASTDGGMGALTALGLKAFDASGQLLPLGGGSLTRLDHVSLEDLLPPPPDGVELLVDVTSPLYGPKGAASVFGPQKGASPKDIALLEAGLVRLAEVLGGQPQTPGAGSAGGTGYGLATGWAARFVPGAPRIAELTGLVEACAQADVVILGEGRLDSTSFAGKVVDHALGLSESAPWRIIVAGDVVATPPADSIQTVSLTRLAGSPQEAMAHADSLIVKAGGVAAQRVTSS